MSPAFQKEKNQLEKTRIICLYKESLSKQILVRQDLISPDFRSIWIEYSELQKESIIIGGFCREWNHKGDKTEAGQVKRMELFAQQIEKAAEENKKCIVMGDANLCASKWKDEKFGYKNIAEPILNTLEQCGLSISNIGTSNNTRLFVILLTITDIIKLGHFQFNFKII